MQDVNLSGHWEGTIVYGKDYKIYQGKELFFDLELAHYEHQVAGTAVDTRGFGMSPDPANILGTFKNNEISFIKRYKSLHYFTESGAKADRSKRGPDIDYSGWYEEATGLFSGQWRIKIWVLFLWIFPIRLKCGGTWIMRKK